MRKLKKYTGILLTVVLVLSLSVSVFASSKKDKSNCSCHINVFSVQVNGKTYTADGNNTYYIEKADELNLKQFFGEVQKDPLHTDVHPVRLEYSYTDADGSYKYLNGGSENEVKPKLLNQNINFKGKSDIYFKLFLAERNDMAKYIHLKTCSEYKITYLLNGGDSQGNPELFTELTETFTLKKPVKEGYTFTGWTGTGLSVKTADVTIQKGSAGDRTYTANWEKIQTTAAEETTTQKQLPDNPGSEGGKKTENKEKAKEREKTQEKKRSDVAKAGDVSLTGMVPYMVGCLAALTMVLAVYIKRRKS